MTLHLCPRRFSEDQRFSEVQSSSVQRLELPNGRWYISVNGDLAGRVAGAVYHLGPGDEPQKIPMEVGSWAGLLPADQCRLLLHNCWGGHHVHLSPGPAACQLRAPHACTTLPALQHAILQRACQLW